MKMVLPKQTVIKLFIVFTCLLSSCTHFIKYSPPEIVSIGELRVDTELEYRLYSPDWSPDGNKLIVSTDMNHLHIFDLVGHSMQVLSMAPPTAFNQAWSPIGNDILYTDDDGPSIWVLPTLDIKAEPKKFSNGVIANWSPGGEKIVVGKINAAEEGYVKILEVSIIDVENNNEKNIYSFEGILSGIVEIEWSPNGNFIAFWQTFYLTDDFISDSRKGNLIIIDINNNQIVEMQEDHGLGGINWSQDSKKVLYLIDTDFEGSVFRIRDIQGNCTEISSDLSLVNFPKLSPDESMLAYGGRDGGIYVIETDLALGADFWESGVSCDSQ